MGVKTMLTRGLVVTMIGTTATLSLANYKGDLKTTLESNLTDLETMLSGYSAKFKEQKATIAQHLATIGANETTIANLNSQVSTLTSEKNALTTEKNGLTSQINGIASLLNISTSNKSIDEIVTEIQNNINTNTEVSSDELATFKTIAINLGKTQDEVNNMSRNELVGYINQSVANLNAELDEANKEIAKYENEIEKANAEISRLEGEVAKLQAEISRLEGIIAQYEGDLRAMNTKAESIEETYKNEYNSEIKGKGQVEVNGNEGNNAQTKYCLTCNVNYVGEHTCGTTQEPTQPSQPTVTLTTNEQILKTALNGKTVASIENHTEKVGWYHVTINGNYDDTIGTSLKSQGWSVAQTWSDSGNVYIVDNGELYLHQDIVKTVDADNLK